MTEFRYFRDPHGSSASTWRDEAAPCGLCGERRAGYAGPYHGVEPVDHVCEPCLVAGRLAEHGLTTNEGDPGALGVDAEVAETRRAELEERTPRLVTWQELLWPAHCGDFCRFDQEVGRRELAALAPDGDGPSFFREHVHDDLREADFGWDELPERGPAGRDATDPAVYLFRCVTCDRPVLWWDFS